VPGVVAARRRLCVSQQRKCATSEPMAAVSTHQVLPAFVPANVEICASARSGAAPARMGGERRDQKPSLWVKVRQMAMAQQEPIACSTDVDRSGGLFRRRPQRVSDFLDLPACRCSDRI